MLHAGWPGGLILGGLASTFMVGKVRWEIQMSLFLIPVVMLVSNNNQTVAVAMGLTRGQNMSDPTLQAAADELALDALLV